MQRKYGVWGKKWERQGWIQLQGDACDALRVMEEYQYHASLPQKIRALTLFLRDFSTDFSYTRTSSLIIDTKKKSSTKSVLWKYADSFSNSWNVIVSLEISRTRNVNFPKLVFLLLLIV